ncbi:MAG: amino acid transporter [Chloroflexota bacterium]|nr:amino acid transporter [Chloroflexota bacterium]
MADIAPSAASTATEPGVLAPSGARPIRHYGRVKSWLLQEPPDPPEGFYEKAAHHPTHAWWRVVCLTGVDYFSSLGYAPGIAALAAGALSPIATLILVLVTLFGALPMYRYVAGKSPHGDGSISMLERLLPWWQGKVFVLCLIGFVSTGFVITITLSAADAAAHIVENPAAHAIHGYAILVTLFLIALLGAVFLKGFSEAIGIAVVLVFVYIALNIVVIGDGLIAIVQHPQLVSTWHNSLVRVHGNPLFMFLAAAILFPKLALGLSGFETGVLVMPLIRGDQGDDPIHPAGRIRNGRKLLTAAALIMSVLLFTSSIVATLLIPASAFQPGGHANGRALAYLAHARFGDGFGTAYDISTIAILWFAGASAMAGLLNIVPRYLPRYGMAPDWARAARPLAILVTAICFLVTLIFAASVDAQAGAYATGVLAVMTSASVAVMLSVRRRGARTLTIAFGVIAAIFIYTLGNTVISQPEGIKIAGCFIAAIIVTSLISRVFRSTELRVSKVELDETAQRYIDEATHGTIRIIANHPDERNGREYLLKEREQREDNHIPPGDPVLFLEVTVSDASEFAPVIRVRGEEIDGYRVLRADSSAIPNTIAAILLYIRDITGKRPHVYFGWTEGNPLKHLASYILFGEGDIAPVTHEVLREAERDPKSRPAIHVG